MRKRKKKWERKWEKKLKKVHTFHLSLQLPLSILSLLHNCYCIIICATDFTSAHTRHECVCLQVCESQVQKDWIFILIFFLLRLVFPSLSVFLSLFLHCLSSFVPNDKLINKFSFNYRQIYDFVLADCLRATPMSRISRMRVYNSE